MHFRTIYDRLGKVGESEHQELCRQRVEEIEPQIRLCNYKLKGRSDAPKEAAIDTTHLDSKLAELSLSNQKMEGEEVTWAGRRLIVKSDKVRLAISTSQGYESDVKSSGSVDAKMPVYDKLLGSYADGLATVRDEIQNVRFPF